MKILSLGLLFFFSTSLLAESYYYLRPGKRIYVDTEDLTGNIVSFRFGATHPRGDLKPRVSIHNQWAWFKCSHEKTYARSTSFNNDLQTFSREWEVQIRWSPGVPTSGCSILIMFPGMEPSEVEIFVNDDF